MMSVGLYLNDGPRSQVMHNLDPVIVGFKSCTTGLNVFTSVTVNCAIQNAHRQSTFPGTGSTTDWPLQLQESFTKEFCGKSRVIDAPG
jgi:hypothetical protein